MVFKPPFPVGPRAAPWWLSAAQPSPSRCPPEKIWPRPFKMWGKKHAGWWFFATPLKNMKVHWDDEIPNGKKTNGNHSPPTRKAIFEFKPRRFETDDFKGITIAVVLLFFWTFSSAKRWKSWLCPPSDDHFRDRFFEVRNVHRELSQLSLQNSRLKWCWSDHDAFISPLGKNKSHQIWLVVGPPLWTIWVRQLGWLETQYMGK